MINPAKFAVAIIVLRYSTNIEEWEAVLVARKDDHSKWSLPGGKVDPGESSPLAAYRELLEETGIDLKQSQRIDGLHPVPTTRLIPQGTVFDSGGYFTTFYLLDTTGIDLPHAFEVAEHEAPVKWGPIEMLFDGPFGAENRERFMQLGVL